MNRPAKKWSARTKRDLMIEVWEALDCESVGARELDEIQEELGEKFGAGALDSPAAIARILADEGAVLRHPEVFNFDLKWRKQKMAQGMFQGELNFSDLRSGFESIVKIEAKRLQLQTELHRGTGEKEKGERETNNTAAGLKECRDAVAAARGDSLLRARSKILDEQERSEAREIAEWLRVWLQAPELFSDWIDLRRRSPEFRQRFGG